MRISYWSSDVCSSDLHRPACDRRRLNGGHFFDTALIAMPAPRPPAPLASEVAVDNPCTIFPVRTPAQANAITQNVGSTMNIIAMTKFSRSEEHTSELQSLMRISYAVFCLKKKKTQN